LKIIVKMVVFKAILSADCVRVPTFGTKAEENYLHMRG